MSEMRRALARAPEELSKGAKGRSAAIRLALVVVAVPALAVAGIKIYTTIAEELKKPEPPPRPAAPGTAGFDRQTGPSDGQTGPSDSGMVTARSRVSVYPPAAGTAAPATIALGMPFAAQAPGFSRSARAGILERELIRQAFLLAARDELGLLTRDEVLGERSNPAAQETPVPISPRSHGKAD